MYFRRLRLTRFRRIHGRIYDYWINIKIKIAYIKGMLLPFGEKIYVFGTPLHKNIGDSAIVIAQMRFLQKCGYSENRIKEITQKEYRDKERIIKKLISKRSVICLVGGGNMGDEWSEEEYFRKSVIKDFSNNKIVVFPQTIFYSKTEKGKKEKQESIPIYENHPNLTLIAREKKSFDLMKKLYPNTNVLMTPDIVLSMSMNEFGAKKSIRNGILLCMRMDVERKVTDQEQEELEDFLSEVGLIYRKTDMYSQDSITKENRQEKVIDKMEEFARAELVITDRLHGMVFATITETPCIVLSNYNYKVKGTYEWIKNLGYVYFADDISEVKRIVEEKQENIMLRFDNSKLLPYFEQIQEVIAN